MYTFIQLPTIPYDYMVQRPQHMMKWLSLKGNMIYYIENSSKTYIIKKSEKLNVIGKNYDIKNITFNNPIILWCSSPKHVQYIDKYPHDYIIFDAVDNDTNELADWKPYTDSIVMKANIVFAASNFLYQKFKIMHPETHLVENAVDYEHFSQINNMYPVDLPSYTSCRKLVGYTGAVAKWINWELINFISKNSSYDYIFVGPCINSLSHIAHENKFRNIHFLGYKEYRKVPNYVNNFNCCLVPFRVNSMTYASNPIKIYEYFAAGKPVVSTGIEAVQAFRDICYIADTKEEYLDCINKAVNEEDVSLIKKRIDTAKQNSWESRVDKILNILCTRVRV